MSHMVTMRERLIERTPFPRTAATANGAGPFNGSPQYVTVIWRVSLPLHVAVPQAPA